MMMRLKQSNLIQTTPTTRQTTYPSRMTPYLQQFFRAALGSSFSTTTRTANSYAVVEDEDSEDDGSPSPVVDHVASLYRATDGGVVFATNYTEYDIDLC